MLTIRNFTEGGEVVIYIHAGYDKARASVPGQRSLMMMMMAIVASDVVTSVTVRLELVSATATAWSEVSLK